MPSRRIWENWVDQHSTKLILYARRWTNDPSVAEDWVQESFLRLWKRRDAVEDPVFYLHRSIRNLAVDQSRRRKSESKRIEEIQIRSQPFQMFQCPAEQGEWKDAVEKALLDLPDEQSEVVTLKIWSQLTFAQIADLTGSPIGTVTSRYRYAMSTLKSLLSEHHCYEG